MYVREHEETCFRHVWQNKTLLVCLYSRGCQIPFRRWWMSHVEICFYQAYLLASESLGSLYTLITAISSPFLWELEVYYRFHNSPPVDSDLCRRSQIHILTPCERRLHVNIISPCIPNIWHGSFPSYLSIKFSAVYAALSSYHIHLAMIILVVHTQLCNLRRSGHFCSWAYYILSLRYGRFRQHPVLEHPQAALLS
jgi:hypothetical protein